MNHLDTAATLAHLAEAGHTNAWLKLCLLAAREMEEAQRELAAAVADTDKQLPAAAIGGLCKQHLARTRQRAPATSAPSLTSCVRSSYRNGNRNNRSSTRCRFSARACPQAPGRRRPGQSGRTFRGKRHGRSELGDDWCHAKPRCYFTLPHSQLARSAPTRGPRRLRRRRLSASEATPTAARAG